MWSLEEYVRLSGFTLILAGADVEDSAWLASRYGDEGKKIVLHNFFLSSRSGLLYEYMHTIFAPVIIQ
jgi:hypothetical protein